VNPLFRRVLTAWLLAWLIFFCAAPVFPFGQESDFYARKRRLMVKEQLASRDITDSRVLEAMGRVPRHLFVPPAERDQAYEDYPLPIGEGQTISQPYIVAFMTQSLALKGGEKVLEVGTGSGYQAAVLGDMGVRVFSIEINAVLAARAVRTLRELGSMNVQVKTGDGFFGWPEMAPFDAVIVTCAVDRIPPALFEQLKEGGRMVLPLGGVNQIQVLTLVTKVAGQPRSKEILDVRFVPMTGEAQKKRD
jgi:protein-L-isoaspartate(D-aspartate) O-methyltransferase